MKRETTFETSLCVNTLDLRNNYIWKENHTGFFFHINVTSLKVTRLKVKLAKIP